MSNRVWLYFLGFCGICSLGLVAFLYQPGQDHLGSISLGDDPSWHMNVRFTNKTLYEDRDIFYHNIGNSIKYAKRADIVIFGHSMALFAIDWRQLEAFAKKHDIKIYNMAFASDTSGEFSFRIVKKYHIQPKIWIINADDMNGGASYFESYLHTEGVGSQGDVISYSRWHAYKNVISKNITWKWELFLRGVLPKSFIDFIYPTQSIFNYRSIKHGNWLNDDWPQYSVKHDTFKNTREPDCHAASKEYGWAQQYVNRLGGGEVVLMLIPYNTSCRKRLEEIASYLHVPSITTDWQDLSSFDLGGHLDKAGATTFTSELIRQLEKTAAFKKLIAEKKLNKISRKG